VKNQKTMTNEFKVSSIIRGVIVVVVLIIIIAILLVNVQLKGVEAEKCVEVIQEQRKLLAALKLNINEYRAEEDSRIPDADNMDRLLQKKYEIQKVMLLGDELLQKYNC